MENGIKVSCKEYAAIIKKELKEKVEYIGFKAPKLVVFQVDNDQASNAYIRGKRNDCEEVGIGFELVRIDSDEDDQEKFCKLLKQYNRKPEVFGIIIQLPIPDKYDLDKLISCISPYADVDGFRKDSRHLPCTPLGIMNWLVYNDVELEGKDICVVGRSDIVGKPLVNMLIDKGATVTCCNSHTECLAAHTYRADIVITAIGKPKFFNSLYFNDKTTKMIIDVGINRDSDGKLCGDVDVEDVKSRYPDIYITPVPGGVGLLTRVQLLDNILRRF